MVVFKITKLLVSLQMISIITFANAEVLTKKAFFSAAKPDEASATRILLGSFSSPSELACSQKCLRHDQCNFKKYNPETKQCDLLRHINKEDLSKNAVATKKESFCNNEHSLCKPNLCTGCGKNCKCEYASGRHTCNCIQRGPYKSCKAALERNNFQTAVYQIFPANFENTVNVKCMKDEQGTSFAVLHHNKEEPVVVHGYENRGSYKFTFTYMMNMSIIMSLVNQSSHCQQFTKAGCYMAVFRSTSSGLHTWIHGRDGQKLQFWGGGPSNGVGCACGITGSCAGRENAKCNCDANDRVWRVDEGYVVKKDVLPITSIAVGDTGDKSEEFIYTIGPLLCVV